MVCVGELAREYVVLPPLNAVVEVLDERIIPVSVVTFTSRALFAHTLVAMHVRMHLGVQPEYGRHQLKLIRLSRHLHNDQ